MQWTAQRMHVSQTLHACKLHAASPAAISGCLQNCMTKDVFNQLQKISVQQSKIKSVKSRLSVYQDIANKHAETFAELQLVKRVPVAYRHCLAECMRRSAFHCLPFALQPAFYSLPFALQLACNCLPFVLEPAFHSLPLAVQPAFFSLLSAPYSACYIQPFAQRQLAKHVSMVCYHLKAEFMRAWGILWRGS